MEHPEKEDYLDVNKGNETNELEESQRHLQDLARRPWKEPNTDKGHSKFPPVDTASRIVNKSMVAH